eukprot:scaffold6976_cov69-Phaeocystis_antarctica.AAC.2
MLGWATTRKYRAALRTRLHPARIDLLLDVAILVAHPDEAVWVDELDVARVHLGFILAVQGGMKARVDSHSFGQVHGDHGAASRLGSGGVRGTLVVVGELAKEP